MRKPDDTDLVRTTVMVPADLLASMRDLAARGDRPLAREVRRALETHVERENMEEAA